MNLARPILITVLSLIINVATAQEFMGVATYKSKRQLDIKLDSTQISGEMHKQMMEMMKKQFEKTHILSFNKEASIYKEDEALAPPSPAGMQVMVVNSNGSDVLYKNIKENRYVNQNEVFGKVFLIKDTLEEPKWIMHNESKNIGEYTCFKATMTNEVEIKGETGISINGDKDLDDETITKKTITVTAWYTPQIPVSHGPENFQGLPGLILEVNDGSQSIMCSKIVLNPEESIIIDEPKKGKEVNQSEFEIIMEKKLKEMEERYSSDRDDGNSIEIKIKG